MSELLEHNLLYIANSIELINLNHHEKFKLKVGYCLYIWSIKKIIIFNKNYMEFNNFLLNETFIDETQLFVKMFNFLYS